MCPVLLVLLRLSSVIGVQSTKDLIIAAVEKQSHTDNTLVADATVILKGVNSGIADIVAGEAQKLRFVWQFKTQILTVAEQWDTNISSTAFIAWGILHTKAYVWFFESETQAIAARHEFRSKARNRGFEHT